MNQHRQSVENSDIIQKRIEIISRFAGMKFQAVQEGQISRYDYIGKSNFIPEEFFGTVFFLVFV